MRTLSLPGFVVVCAVVLTGCGGGSDGGGSGGQGATSGGGSGGSGGESGGSGGIGGASGAAGSGGSAGTGGSAGAGGSGGAPSGKWSLGYYASWQESQYPVSAIEWSGLTQIAVSFYTPSASGGLSLLSGSATLAEDIVQAAHAHGVKAIASIGGADSRPDFLAATASSAKSAFIANLVKLIEQDGYDGIDIDWEPLEAADQAMVAEIASSVKAAHAGALMTIPIGIINTNLPEDLSGYAAIAAQYDQLDIMSYGMAGPWQGWKSWHSSPLYSQDSATPTSIDSSVQAYVTAGVPKAKLGIGIGFYGLCYTPPVTAPVQALSGSTIAADDGTMSYAHILGSYYAASDRKWDDFAKVPYLSFSGGKGPEGCSYISYDDEQSIAEKAKYVKDQGLGGVIQWEITEGYVPNAPAGQQSPLLTAIHDNLL
ncbi:MAG: glycoside hydrolase family 18 protein [Myxococcales bacterium]|nr:glycoside hydrolase family 18 protein [Myxococcales bacterium]MCB9581790.1 glycoside hydrolase family 18 protein [Polyangiaceae bacterium]